MHDPAEQEIQSKRNKYVPINKSFPFDYSVVLTNARFYNSLQHNPDF